MMQNTSATQQTGQNTTSASQPMLQQQSATSIHPVTPTKILVSRLPHQNGVNWVFHDPAVGLVWHVNVPHVHPMAQQSVNQSASQPITTSGIVLYQQPPNHTPQLTPPMASASQPTAPAPTHTASAAHPMAPASPQPVQVPSQQTLIANQQIDWSAKIAEVIREQFGLRPKQQSVNAGLHIRLFMISFPSHTSIRCLISQSFRDKEMFPQSSTLIDS